ncbi:MAG: PIN domain nuclease [Leptolyngbya foveolarum]|uniref:PIN domain nuclease n=1 Tax=Leptolyngbya foveolarum TaxID=47253 RepID=A0A2W4U338_9CYAN|nr:MAG: PIN domain nuclease [Leptolyngbya foveolarum]
MKLLLDTHTFIWWDSAPDKLSETALTLIYEADNTVMLSVVSVWEIQIKSQIGKLALTSPLADIVRTQQSINGIEVLPIALNHVMTLDQLPLHHKDPFDRMLIAQAISEKAMLISRDAALARYSVSVRW